MFFLLPSSWQSLTDSLRTRSITISSRKPFLRWSTFLFQAKIISLFFDQHCKMHLVSTLVTAVLTLGCAALRHCVFNVTLSPLRAETASGLTVYSWHPSRCLKQSWWSRSIACLVTWFHCFIWSHSVFPIRQRTALDWRPHHSSFHCQDQAEYNRYPTNVNFFVNEMLNLSLISAAPSSTFQWNNMNFSVVANIITVSPPSLQSHKYLMAF